MTREPVSPGTLLHVYNSIGVGIYGTICGLSSRETPNLHVVSIDTGARCASTGFLGDYAVYTICDACFSDKRVAMKTLVLV